MALVGGAEYDKSYALIIEFDSHGVVQRCENKVEKFGSDLTYGDLTTW